VSWLDHIEDRVNELLVALERIAAALEKIEVHLERLEENTRERAS